MGKAHKWDSKVIIPFYFCYDEYAEVRFNAYFTTTTKMGEEELNLTNAVGYSIQFQFQLQSEFEFVRSLIFFHSVDKTQLRSAEEI